MKRIITVLCLCGLIQLAGCSGDGLDTYPASGVVTLDGKPVAGAGVLFMPTDGPTASGTTDEQGRYKLMTGELEGAIAGPHRVMITLMKITGIEVTTDGLEGAIDTGGIKKEYIVPEKYSKIETSGLTAEVSDAKSEYDFALSSN